MFTKINLSSLVGSAVIGMVVSVFYTAINMDGFESDLLLLTLFIGGGIGLVIGTLTEAITAIIPISMANAKNFIVINTLIGTLITGLLLIASNFYMGFVAPIASTLKVIGIAAIAIIIVNVIEYMAYQRLNKQLNTFKSKL